MDSLCHNIRNGTAGLKGLLLKYKVPNTIMAEFMTQIERIEKALNVYVAKTIKQEHERHEQRN